MTRRSRTTAALLIGSTVVALMGGYFAGGTEGTTAVAWGLFVGAQIGLWSNDQ